MTEVTGNLKASAFGASAFDDAFDHDSDSFDDSEILQELAIKDQTSLNRQIHTTTIHLPKQSTLGGGIVPGLYEEIRTTISYGPTHHQFDYQALQSYIYPMNLELRDYQFNIVRHTFYKNLLCALPTGLGKTFIASTVMLNYYRWVPQGKIIFMAPTRPLVAQQIKAFCGITGIPPSDAAVLLDKTKRNREEIWRDKRVFFTTPQVVENDLAHGSINPKDICLLVIDEAHRSRGNYAYHNVVKFINRFNHSYRLLALTATPAADVEGVQEIVDNLGISKIEVRTEESMDIKKYMMEKEVERIRVVNTDEMEELIDLLAEAAAPLLDIANAAHVYDITDPRRINAFMAMDSIRRLSADRTLGPAKFAHLPVLRVLFIVGHALGRIKMYGIRPFYAYFKEKYAEFSAKAKSNRSAKTTNEGIFYTHEAIPRILARCEELVETPMFMGHPKLDHTIDELMGFFKQALPDSKVIIFTEFRESALDIVRAIELVGRNAEAVTRALGTPLESAIQDDLRSHIFIGQAPEKDKFDEAKYLEKKKKSSKKLKHFNPDEELGDEVAPKPKRAPKKKDSDNRSMSRLESSYDANLKGMSQKMQKELIRKFKAGEYNILVATSIGEEGLDIGEVDMIICYDSTRSPIKNVQRMGRTGRKRNGKVVLLFAGNEESKFDAAMAGYEYIQNHIVSSNVIQLKPSDRIIPNGHEPVCEKRFIELPQESVEIANAAEDEDEILKIAMAYMMPKPKKGKKGKAEPAKKSVKQFFMPDNVDTGFKSASKLVQKVEPQVEADENTSYVSFDSFIKEKEAGSDLLKRPFNILDGLSDEEDLNQSPGKRKLVSPVEESLNLLNGLNVLPASSPNIPVSPNDPHIATPKNTSHVSSSKPAVTDSVKPKKTGASLGPKKAPTGPNVLESLRMANKLRVVRPTDVPVIQNPHNTSIDDPMVIDDEEEFIQPGNTEYGVSINLSDSDDDELAAMLQSRIGSAVKATSFIEGVEKLPVKPAGFDEFDDSFDEWEAPVEAAKVVSPVNVPEILPMASKPGLTLKRETYSQDALFDIDGTRSKLALTKAESTDLFTNYYYDLEPEEVIDYLTPNISARKDIDVVNIPHRSATARYIAWTKAARSRTAHQTQEWENSDKSHLLFGHNNGNVVVE
ncbi:hypothetical protein BABINDRAFT_161513 [Babjeviella inositovora NRRL Y-12698]|uniref:ATP-dependent DNA helicase n=1 Tax=Babjeviella inositovora NRRL Y-12698 TaxID=984486 RepID=A0A1E3QQ69_9ASCO|nr:uncharacterized protein BABINDRAFT_161513 [Babjeviella inositovora NRRL Y-12698]ODQ79825.1 hypothetical protein BABINDRAFT_161513 [Babjeviella inositovora NRRL Y-12698]